MSPGSTVQTVGATVHGWGTWDQIPALSLTGYGEDQMSFSHTAGEKAWLLGKGLKDLNSVFPRNDHMDPLRMEGCHGDSCVSHGACRHGRKNSHTCGLGIWRSRKQASSLAPAQTVVNRSKVCEWEVGRRWKKQKNKNKNYEDHNRLKQ